MNKIHIIKHKYGLQIIPLIIFFLLAVWKPTAVFSSEEITSIEPENSYTETNITSNDDTDTNNTDTDTVINKDDTDFSNSSDSFAADSLCIKVGYYGGPYYEKRTYSLSELEAMEQVRQEYTYINILPNIVIDYAEGVRLTEVLEGADIDLNSIAEFHFYTQDVSDTYFNTFTKFFLLDTKRYYFPKLRECFDWEKGCGLEGAEEGAVEVVPLLTLRENWTTYELDDSSEGFGSMTYENRFRLAYGQRNTYEVTSRDSAKWIHTIYVTLTGHPTNIVLSKEILELKIGSSHQLKAKLSVTDDTADRTLTWSSSDETVAKVSSKGKITLVGEGTAVITVTTVNGLTAQVTVNGKKETAKREEQAEKIVTAEEAEATDEINETGVTEKAEAAGETKTKDEVDAADEEEVTEEMEAVKEADITKKIEVIEKTENTEIEKEPKKQELKEDKLLEYENKINYEISELYNEGSQKEIKLKDQANITLQKPEGHRIYELPEDVLSLPEIVDEEKQQKSYLITAGGAGMFFLLGAGIWLIKYRFEV